MPVRPHRLSRLLASTAAAAATGLAVCAGLAIALPARVAAQTAGQIVQETYAPPVVRGTDGALTLPQTTGLAAPAGAEALFVTPSRLEVEGGFPELSAETARIEALIAGRRVSGAELFAAASELEAAYDRAGYLLVRVALPPQTVRDGAPLRLVVIDGALEAIDASALDAGARARVEAILAPLVGQRRITRAKIERRLLLAGDTPGVELRSAIAAGRTPGTSVIVVEGRHDPVTASVSAGNDMSEGLGTWSATAGVDFNNLAGLGEVVYLRFGGYAGLGQRWVFDDEPRNRQIVAGLTLPLGTDGMWAGLEAVDSHTLPKTGAAVATSDHFRRLSARLGYSWIRSRALNTSSTLAFDIVDERQKLLFGPISTDFTLDRLRVLRLTQSVDAFTQWGRLNATLGLALGLDAFGARHGTPLLPLSRQGAEPDFAKLDIALGYGTGLWRNRLDLRLNARAQTSFGDALPGSEQMGLGGPDWLSAFDSSAVQGDAAAMLRAELAAPVPLPQIAALPRHSAVLSPYVFGAAGLAKLEAPTALEREVTRVAAFGAGLRLGLSEAGSPRSMGLSLEYAHGTSSARDDEDRVNLRLRVSF